MKKKLINFPAIAFLLSCLIPSASWACAGGCTMFDIGTAALIPNASGGMVFLQYDDVNQNRQWNRPAEIDSHTAHEQDIHSDKKIHSEFYTLGGQYMFNRKWGLMARIPYATRKIEVADHHNQINSYAHNSLGDVKLTGIYSGFEADMSSGLMFGLKLPTGVDNHNGFEYDTQIGSGSTDSILGAYKMGKITQDAKLNYFAQTTWQKAVIWRDKFRPGDEISASGGLYYNLGQVGIFSNIAPMLQIIGTHKSRNNGEAARYMDSGYRKVFIAPGLELNFNQFKIYGDVQFAAYQHINGQQLTAMKQLRMILGYKF